MYQHKAAKTYVLLFVLSWFFSCSRSPLTEHVPKNPEEKKIIDLLIRYQDAKINCNLERFMACLHEQGLYQLAGGSLISKNELKGRLPLFWAGLQSGSPAIYPINREMITGDYFRTGRFYDSQIVINGDTAHATVTFVKWGWHLDHYITMRREKDGWLILRLDWETN